MDIYHLNRYPRRAKTPRTSLQKFIHPNNHLFLASSVELCDNQNHLLLITFLLHGFHTSWLYNDNSSYIEIIFVIHCNSVLNALQKKVHHDMTKVSTKFVRSYRSVRKKIWSSPYVNREQILRNIWKVGLAFLFLQAKQLITNKKNGWGPDKKKNTKHILTVSCMISNWQSHNLLDHLRNKNAWLYLIWQMSEKGTKLYITFNLIS